jgi:hypothetical protein
MFSSGFINQISPAAAGRIIINIPISLMTIDDKMLRLNVHFIIDVKTKSFLSAQISGVRMYALHLELSTGATSLKY